MRILVFFDLPMETNVDVRNYTRFRKYLVKSGYIMMQKSVYTKLVLNGTAAGSMMTNIRKNKPPIGLVQMMIITEKQFERMEFIVGESNSEMLESTDRVVII